MKKINVAIVGTGYMAQQHFNAINSFKQFNIICVVGRNKKRLQIFANKNSIKNYLCDIKTAYNKFKPDFVIIAVSELSLKKIITDIIKYPWTCLCEKPVGYNYSESKIIYKQIKKIKKKNFFVSLNRRFFNSTLNALKILKNYKGKIEILINDQADLNIQKKNGVPKKVIRNFMYANSVHLIDYIRLFCKGHINSIRNINFLNKKPEILSSKIKFTSGDEATYTVVYNVASPWYVIIKAQKKIIVMKPIEKFFLSNSKIINKTKSFLDKNFKPGLKMQLYEVLKYFNKKKYNLTTIDNYIQTVEIIKKIYEK